MTRMQAMLNKLTPGAWKSKLGDKLQEIITLINVLHDDHDTNKAATDGAAVVLLNLALAAPGLVIGSVSAAKVKITNTVAYLIAGAWKSISTQEVAFTPTTHDIVANASTVQEAVYVLSVNGAGTVAITKGATATGSGNAVAPAVPANQALLGTVRIAVAAGVTNFTAGTTLLSNGALTVTYTDAACLPAQVPATSANLGTTVPKVDVLK